MKQAGKGNTGEFSYQVKLKFKFLQDLIFFSAFLCGYFPYFGLNL
jgi:hypothetical protein